MHWSIKIYWNFTVGTKLRDTGNQEQSFEKPVPEQKSWFWPITSYRLLKIMFDCAEW